MRDCGDAMLELRESATDAGVSSRSHPWRLAIGAAAGMMLGAAAMYLAGGRPAPPSDASSPALARFAFITSSDTFGGGGQLPMAISPDGKQVVYSANQQLLVRSLGELAPRPIPGTERMQMPAGERGNTGF